MSDPALRHIRSLARAGATSQAWQLLEASDLSSASQLDVMTLKGRLLKDRARLASGTVRRQLFAEAAKAYEAAAEGLADSYPLINAAAMALFSGDRAGAQALARQVLHLLDSGEDRGETPYWGEATRAEALLLLGERSAAQASLHHAISLAPDAWEDRAATLRQFALIEAHAGADSSWLDTLRPPPVLHFSGIIGIADDDADAAQRIADAIAEIGPGFAFGALAAGADIIIAEKLVEQGSELHIVLPSDPIDFRRSSVDPMGPVWTERFSRLIEQADSVIICGSGAPTSSAGVALAELHSMGLAAELAGQLETRALALRVEPAGRSGRSDPWRLSGRALRSVEIDSDPGLALAPLPEDRLLFDVSVDGEVALANDLSNAADTLFAARGRLCAIDCRIGGEMRINAILSHGQIGMVAASRDAALALLACGAIKRIEPIGEMASATGAVELCLVALSDQRG